MTWRKLLALVSLTLVVPNLLWANTESYFNRAGLCRTYTYSYCSLMFVTAEAALCDTTGMDITTTATTTFAPLDLTEGSNIVTILTNTGDFTKDATRFAFVYDSPDGSPRDWNYRVDFNLRSTATADRILQAQIAAGSSCALTGTEGFQEILRDNQTGQAGFAIDAETQFHFMGRINLDDDDCLGPIIRIGAATMDLLFRSLSVKFWTDEC